MASEYVRAASGTKIRYDSIQIHDTMGRSWVFLPADPQVGFTAAELEQVWEKFSETQISFETSSYTFPVPLL